MAEDYPVPQHQPTLAEAISWLYSAPQCEYSNELRLSLRFGPYTGSGPHKEINFSRCPDGTLLLNVSDPLTATDQEQELGFARLTPDLFRQHASGAVVGARFSIWAPSGAQDYLWADIVDH